MLCTFNTLWTLKGTIPPFFFVSSLFPCVCLFWHQHHVPFWADFWCGGKFLVPLSCRDRNLLAAETQAVRQLQQLFAERLINCMETQADLSDPSFDQALDALQLCCSPLSLYLFFGPLPLLVLDLSLNMGGTVPVFSPRPCDLLSRAGSGSCNAWRQWAPSRPWKSVRHG